MRDRSIGHVQIDLHVQERWMAVPQITAGWAT
jgi:hypothetical protein